MRTRQDVGILFTVAAIEDKYHMSLPSHPPVVLSYGNNIVRMRVKPSPITYGHELLVETERRVGVGR